MRTLIISNRAPVNISKIGNDYEYAESSGGLASGLSAYIDKVKTSDPSAEFIWVGWPGSTIQDKDQEKVRSDLWRKFGLISVFLSEESMEMFYEGFCNKTIWPLFHYFPMYTHYNEAYWRTYIEVNKAFLEEVKKIHKEGDVIWVHDYHLMLLPEMIREAIPKATIGFFLHIPFPAYEIFRMLPSEWRKKLLEGLLGSDLIGFHTHDYRTYFLRSVMRILGLSHQSGEIIYKNRLIKADSFPMSIDYEKFHGALHEEAVETEKLKLSSALPHQKLILSIDRQDYSKGILNRLRGYEMFLKDHPEAREKVSMIMIVIPSRVGVESYVEIKSQIDELSGRVNGTYGTLSWTPIVYQYRSLSFQELIALYALADVALITPLRDGMNLIAKEYIACRDGKGVLILSEMAGAAEELTEAVIINPNNIGEIAESIHYSLRMNEQEQSNRILSMQRRLREYDIQKWALDFFQSLNEQRRKQLRMEARMINEEAKANIILKFVSAEHRLIFLDYDGTLRPLAPTPFEAVPDAALKEKISQLSSLHNTEVVLISGRSWEILDHWFGDIAVSLVAEHGLFLREKSSNWKMIRPVRRQWKASAMEMMLSYAEKLPGSLVEEKDYSLAFHYRRSDPALAALRVRELMNQLISFSTNMELKIQRGHKVIELRPVGIDKGIAALTWLNKLPEENRFILAAGDDLTDEDLFRVMPQGSVSIKVGRGASYASYNVESARDIQMLISEILLAIPEKQH